MSIDNILQRYTATAAVPDAANTPDAENVEDFGGWGLLRGVRDRSLSLELRKKDDTVLAVPYTLIEQFLYSPADGITLRVAGREIRIRGRNLNVQADRSVTLFCGLTRHRVPWLAEHSHGAGPANAAATAIESIVW
jgi:hypothetical protein